MLAAVFLAIGVSWAAASRASAFNGESTVIDPSTHELTGPAKTVIERPTFLSENLGEAGAYGGAAEESGAASVFETGGFIPALGPSLLAFTAGAGIGYAICEVLGIEGCNIFESKGSDGTESFYTGESWKFFTEAHTLTSGNVVPADAWQYTSGSGREGVYLEGHTGAEPCYQYITAPAPNNADTFITGGTFHFECGQSPTAVAPVKYALSNRVFRHAATAEGFTKHSYIPPAEWSKKTAAAMEGQKNTPAARVGEKIAERVGTAEVADPYGVTVPNCTGDLWAECKAAVESHKLVPERSSLTWETAVITKPAGAVLELKPAAGATVEIGSKVVVKTNPDESGMPVVIPAPEPNETYSHYITRLATQLKPHEVVVGEAVIDPHTGPEGVIRTSPEVGTRLNPATEHEVEVQTNPATAPPAAGAWAPPSIPAINLNPLTEIKLGCDDFPFGLFCWLKDGLTEWGKEGECPSVSIPVGQGSGVDKSGQLGVNTCEWEPAMEVVRPVFVILLTLSIGIAFGYMAFGSAGGGSVGGE